MPPQKVGHLPILDILQIAFSAAEQEVIDQPPAELQNHEVVPETEVVLGTLVCSVTRSLLRLHCQLVREHNSLVHRCNSLKALESHHEEHRELCEKLDRLKQRSDLLGKLTWWGEGNSFLTLAGATGTLRKDWQVVAHNSWDTRSIFPADHMSNKLFAELGKIARNLSTPETEGPTAHHNPRRKTLGMVRDPRTQALWCLCKVFGDVAKELVPRGEPEFKQWLLKQTIGDIGDKVAQSKFLGEQLRTLLSLLEEALRDEFPRPMSPTAFGLIVRKDWIIEEVCLENPDEWETGRHWFFDPLGGALDALRRATREQQ